MSHRPATLDDYAWLYANGYMPDGLKCARDVMVDIVERCPATFWDYGCGRGDLVRWINSKTMGRAIGWDPAMPGGLLLDRYEFRPTSEYVLCLDVLEHLDESGAMTALANLRLVGTRGAILTISNMSDIHPIRGEEVELHLTRQPWAWWAERIANTWTGWRVQHRPISRDRFAFIVENLEA